MLILAIDTATPAASAALYRDRVLLSENFFNLTMNHSLTIMPGIDHMLGNCGLGIKNLSAVAVSIGPGSFTGLRIGLATAKGLCAGAGLPLIAVPTLDILAHNVVRSPYLVGTLLDARKNEVYMGVYSAVGRFPVPLTKANACSPEQFACSAQALLDAHTSKQIILLGNGVFPYKNVWDQFWGANWLTPAPHLLWPRASALADLASQKYEAGEFEDINRLRPFYIRLSEAEVRLGQGELG